MKYRKHMFALSKAYDLGYNQGIYHKEIKTPVVGSLEPLQGPVAWSKQEFLHAGVKTTIFGGEQRKK